MKYKKHINATFNPCLKESAKNAIACHEKFPDKGGELPCCWVKFTCLCWGWISTKRRGKKGFSRDFLLSAGFLCSRVGILRRKCVNNNYIIERVREKEREKERLDIIFHGRVSQRD